MKVPVPLMEPCPVLSSAMKQTGSTTVNVPIGVATLHGLLTKVALKTLLELVPVAVMVHLPCIFVVEVELPLLDDPQLDNDMTTDSEASITNSFLIKFLLNCVKL